MSTRGASACVLNTPTGLPDWISSVSSSPSSLQRRDDRVEALPVARGAADAAVDDELLRILGDLGIEVVLDHPQRGFGEPALRGARRCRAARGSTRSAWRVAALARGRELIGIVAMHGRSPP